MDYQIVWTEEAQEDFKDIASYLLDNYDFSVADKFTDLFNEKLKYLEKFAKIGMKDEKFSSIRSISLPPHNKVFYTIFENKILILNIIDNRKK